MDRMTLKGILLSASMLALAGAAQAETRIGMITTLSGGGAALGLDVRDGFLLAMAQSGRDDIEVIIADDEQAPDVAVQLADRMVQSDDVDILTGIIWSNLAMAVIPSVTAQGLFYLSPNAGPSQLAGRGCHPNYFNVAWQNDNLHEAAGAYANSAGYTNSFILAPNYPAGQDALAGYKRFYEGGLAGELYTQLGQTDYAAEIAQIRASGADSVFFFLPGGMGISFLRQYADSGLDIPVIGPAFSFDQQILQAVGAAALGVRNTAQWSPDLDNAANVRLRRGQFTAEIKRAGASPRFHASQGGFRNQKPRTLIPFFGGWPVAQTPLPTNPDAFPREALRAARFRQHARRISPLAPKPITRSRTILTSARWGDRTGRYLHQIASIRPRRSQGVEWRTPSPRMPDR